MKNHFSVDARVILTLGRDSIKDHTTALLELVKNSYDADAKKVKVEIFCNSNENYIRVADNGCGMTKSDVENNWLRIGYSEKRTHKISSLKRRKTGEKGIGRISADRLGAILLLKTKAKGKKPIGLRINWDDFDVTNKELTSIDIKVLEQPEIRIPKNAQVISKSGTELIIKNLRQKWDKNDIENLHEELSVLIPPFKKVKDFEIFLETDVAKEFCGKVKSPFYENAEVELNAIFESEKVFFKIKDRYSKKKIAGKIPWIQFVQQSQPVENKEMLKSPKLGSVNLVLLFYPRESSILEGTDLRLSDLRDFLDKNAGVKIYRDNIRVRPYGDPQDPEGDWLGIAERKTREPAGISRPTWKAAANQLVGAVFVSRDNNPNLIDSTSREGLIHGEAFHELKAFVTNCLELLEAHRHKLQIQGKVSAKTEKVKPSEEVQTLKKELSLLGEDLKEVTKHVPDSSQRSIKRTLEQVGAVHERIQKTEKSLEELVSQTRVFRGLATIGIASAVFGHETQSSASEFITAAYTASSILKESPQQIKNAIDEIEKAIKYANHISAWGAFALARVQKEKRKKRLINITSLIENTVKDIDPVFKAVNIDLALKLETVEGNAYAMDIESILLNLLTNAYTACLQTDRKRQVQVLLKNEKNNGREGFYLTVVDSGPGVAEDLKEKIWLPLFTTKVDKEGKQVGTGLGLTVIQSILEDLGGSRRVTIDNVLKGARFEIYLPFS